MLSPPSACQASGGGAGQGGQSGKEGKEGKPKEARAGRSNQVRGNIVIFFVPLFVLSIWSKLKKISKAMLLKDEYVLWVDSFLRILIASSKNVSCCYNYLCC